MKRARNLLTSIADLNNLYHAFWKASRGKTDKPQVQQFAENLLFNLHKIQQQILTQQPDIGHYTYFTIYDPKKRTICAASFAERVLHHAVMNVAHPYFESYQIADSYATRLDKGTYKALHRAQYFCWHNAYYLKLDIRKYFDSIDHEILKGQLLRLFKDKQLLTILFLLIDSYQTCKGKGLPIGNLTSQYFANHYLAAFDHFVKEQLKAKAYLRYMDDMVLCSNSMPDLNRFSEQAENYLNDNLKLDLKIKQQNTTEHGLNFLSYRLFNTHTELAAKSKTRFIDKLKKYDENLNNGDWSQEDYQRHTMPLFAFAEHSSSVGFRKKVFDLQTSAGH